MTKYSNNIQQKNRQNKKNTAEIPHKYIIPSDSGENNSHTHQKNTVILQDKKK